MFNLLANDSEVSFTSPRTTAYLVIGDSVEVQSYVIRVSDLGRHRMWRQQSVSCHHEEYVTHQLLVELSSNEITTQNSRMTLFAAAFNRHRLKVIHSYDTM